MYHFGGITNEPPNFNGIQLGLHYTCRVHRWRLPYNIGAIIDLFDSLDKVSTSPPFVLSEYGQCPGVDRSWRTCCTTSGVRMGVVIDYLPYRTPTRSKLLSIANRRRRKSCERNTLHTACACHVWAGLRFACVPSQALQTCSRVPRYCVRRP